MCEKDINQKVQLSKSLSWLLRHGAHRENLPISTNGFLPVNQILQHKSFKGKCTLQAIQDIVRTDSKKRFTIKTNNSTGEIEIRANQGHSMRNLDNLELTPIKSSSELPNNWIVHGTYRSVLANIRQQGLSRMSRIHIHFCPYEPNDQRVVSGLRPNVQILVYVDVNKAISGGLKFFRSANDVILSEGNASGFIEPKYILKIKDTKTAHYREHFDNTNIPEQKFICAPEHFECSK